MACFWFKSTGSGCAPNDAGPMTHLAPPQTVQEPAPECAVWWTSLDQSQIVPHHTRSVQEPRIKGAKFDETTMQEAVQ
eukprot:1140702-Pelagomonas_calceolata.AAC.5